MTAIEVGCFYKGYGPACIVIARWLAIERRSGGCFTEVYVRGMARPACNGTSMIYMCKNIIKKGYLQKAGSLHSLPSLHRVPFGLNMQLSLQQSWLILCVWCVCVCMCMCV